MDESSNKLLIQHARILESTLLQLIIHPAVSGIYIIPWFSVMSPSNDTLSIAEIFC